MKCVIIKNENLKNVLAAMQDIVKHESRPQVNTIYYDKERESFVATNGKVLLQYQIPTTEEDLKQGLGDTKRWFYLSGDILVETINEGDYVSWWKCIPDDSCMKEIDFWRYDYSKKDRPEINMLGSFARQGVRIGYTSLLYFKKLTPTALYVNKEKPGEKPVIVEGIGFKAVLMPMIV